VPDDEKRMTFLEHLGELRHRLLVCIIALGIGFVIIANTYLNCYQREIGDPSALSRASK
jgi:Sec-independent protein secretion pathway component TatC